MMFFLPKVERYGDFSKRIVNKICFLHEVSLSHKGE